MQRVSTRFFLFTLLLFFSSALLGEGFRAGTLVATPTGSCPIETLLPGDRVISRTKTGEETEALITAVSKKLTMDVRKLVVAGESALVDKNQRFYVANKRAWCAVDALAPGDELISPDGHQFCIEDIHECDKKLTTLYRLTVAHHHNFCIGQSKLVAHNVGAELTTAKTAADAAIAFAAGTGIVVSLPVACAVGGTAIVSYGIYSLVEHIQKKNKPQETQPGQSTNNKKNAQVAQEQHVRIRGFDFTDEELRSMWREEFGEGKPIHVGPNSSGSLGVTQEQPIHTGACLPETKPAITPPTGTCTIQQNQIEKERLLGSADTNGALDPEKIPRCGLQGQTLPSLDSQEKSQGSGDTTATEEQATGSQSSTGTSPAPAEAKHEPSNATLAPEKSPESVSNEANAANEPIDKATKEQSSKTLEELIQDLPQEERKKGPSRQYQKEGGFDQAIEDFESLNPQEIKNIVGGYKGQHGTLPDGRSVNVRSGCSGDSRPTLEVQSTNSNKRIKIRYEE